MVKISALLLSNEVSNVGRMNVFDKFRSSGIGNFEFFKRSKPDPIVWKSNPRSLSFSATFPFALPLLIV